MRKFSLLLALLCASVMGFATQYCEFPTGHLGNADFGDPSGRVLLTLQKDGNNVIVKLKNNTANGNPQTGLNYMWVNATGATNNDAKYGSHSTANSEEISVTVEFSEEKDTYVFNNIHWAYDGFGGEWALDGLTVSASELCEAGGGDPCTDVTAPTISAVSVGSVTYNSAVLTITASDDVAVTGYIVKNGDSQIASSATSPISITGLTAATTYDNIKVMAKDACNNESAEFAVSSFTTEAFTYCSFATGHLGQANFGDANGRILLTLTKLSASSVGVTVEPNNGGADVFDFVEVILGSVSHTLGAVGGSAPTNTEIVFDGLASLDFSINVLWHNHNWADAGGRWTTQSFTVTEAELCPGPINSEYCNYQGAETHQDDHYFAITFETDASGNVVITIGDGAGAGACSFRNGGFEGGNNGLNNFVVSDDDFATTTPATDYFTVTRPTDGDLQYVMTKIADLPANAKIKHLSAGAIAWREAGADRWCFPEFIYTYGGTCNQLDAPTNVSIDANNIITFDAVTGASSYTAYVSLSGVQKYSQVVVSGDELTFTPLVDGDYDVTVVASGTGKTDSDPSSAFVWSLTAAPIVLGNSEYCEHIMQTGTNTEAAFTWETDGSGNIVITISETLGGAADAAHFRGNGMALDNFKVGAGQAAGSNYFTHPGTTTGNQLVLTATTAPDPGEKIYYHGTVEYATSADGNAWPTLDFEWTYGTVCSGKAVSATPNNSTMGTAVVQKAGVDVTNVDDGDEVSFIATVADAELYRFVNWTKAGVEVSTSATYVTTITETTNLIANFEYIRNTYCHTEVTSAQGKKFYLTLCSIGGGQYQIKFEGSSEAKITALNNANFQINGVSTSWDDDGQDVPFSKDNGAWTFDNSGYGSVYTTFELAAGKTWEDIYAWTHNIYFACEGMGEQNLSDVFPARHHIAWNEGCADAEAPVFAKAEAAVIDGSSVRLTIQASDNWEGMLTYTIARESADPIISNHASGEEFTQDVTGLTAGTEYTFTVSVSDGVNVTNQNIVVTPEADSEAPVMGAASLESKTWNSAIINVAATDNLGVASFFIVELDADFVASEGKISVDGLTQGTAYSFTIKAKDGAGNLSENSASVNFTTDAHLTAPTSAADAPTWPAAQVKAVYSQTYNADCNFGYWESGTAYAQETYGKKFTTAGGGYFGLEFVNHLNCINMVKLHFDIWIENDASIGIVPIWGGADVRAFADLTGQQWNSVDLTLTSDFSAVSNWSDVYQIKIDNAPNLTFWIGNVFFYRETPLADSEAPTNVSVSVAKESFQTVTLTVQAEDNSDAVNFRVMNGDDEVATGAAATATATTIVVNNLTPGTNYNFNVIAYDDANNEAAPEAIASTTKALPASAPTPDVTGKNVIPVFSDVITGGPATIHSGGWGETTYPQWFELTESDKVFYAQNFNWAGWHSWGAAIDASKMQYIHLDIYSIGMTQISFTPISTGPKEGVYNITLTPNTWTSVDIPLSEYPATIDMGDVFQFKFMNPVGDNEFMADNVYFWAPIPEPEWETIRTGLEVNRHYTVCLEKNITDIDGATFWSLDKRNAAGTMAYLEEELTPEAGKPYIIQATKATLKVVYGNETAGAPVENGALRGTFVYMDKDALAAAGTNIYMLFNNELRPIGSDNHLDAHRAYVLYNELQAVSTDPVPAPGRRVKGMPLQRDAATGIDELNASEAPVKMIIDGQFFILRGEKLYDATGRLVK